MINENFLKHKIKCKYCGKEVDALRHYRQFCYGGECLLKYRNVKNTKERNVIFLSDFDKEVYKKINKG